MCANINNKCTCTGRDLCVCCVKTATAFICSIHFEMMIVRDGIVHACIADYEMELWKNVSIFRPELGNVRSSVTSKTKNQTHYTLLYWNKVDQQQFCTVECITYTTYKLKSFFLICLCLKLSLYTKPIWIPYIFLSTQLLSLVFD